MTPEIVNLQWEKALLYPAGYATTGSPSPPRVKLPSGWQYGTALDNRPRTRTASPPSSPSTSTPWPTARCSPAHTTAASTSTRAALAVHLNLVGDTAASLNIDRRQIGLYTRHGDAGRPPVRRAPLSTTTNSCSRLTDQLGGIGLEHHRSSENTTAPRLLHRLVEISRRPGPAAARVHPLLERQIPPAGGRIRPTTTSRPQNSLMWVYEGQTEYWGDVLAARAGLHAEGGPRRARRRRRLL